ncbi:hypothetical protein J6590_052426 [Homalodisca vitripennis]|nr:hypothetical protein J6590_052426 [Homalodisca vitripennis]
MAYTSGFRLTHLVPSYTSMILLTHLDPDYTSRTRITHLVSTFDCRNVHVLFCTVQLHLTLGDTSNKLFRGWRRPLKSSCGVKAIGAMEYRLSDQAWNTGWDRYGNIGMRKTCMPTRKAE